MLSGLNDSVVAIDKEISAAENSDSVHELRRYKSSLLQMKTEINNQLKEIKVVQTNVNNSILLYQKAIQLNTGDIF